MNNNNGYFKVWRELFDKPIWLLSTPEQKCIFISILKLANWQEKKWEWCGKPYVCKEGEFITSYCNLAKTAGMGISRQNTRTALKRFENLGFLTYQSTLGEYGGIKVIVLNWATYQNEANQSTNTSLTLHQHFANTSLTPTKELKNIRSKEINNSIGLKNKNFIIPSVEEIKSYCLERNNNVNAQKFYDYYTANGWKVGKNNMKDWHAAVRTWEGNEKSLSSASTYSKNQDEAELAKLTGRDFVSKYEKWSK